MSVKNNMKALKVLQDELPPIINKKKIMCDKSCMAFTIPFGQYRGFKITEIPDNYLFFLADRGRSTYYRSRHSADIDWQPSIEVFEAARKECERRGFKKVGSRWEGKDE